MGEMVDRVAMWLKQHHAGAENSLTTWADVPDEQKAELRTAARDLVSTIRRPTLEMRVKGRSVREKGDEGETWRAMIDGALHEKD